MWVDIDLDLNNRIIAAPGLREALSEFRFKLDTSQELQVRFWRDGVRVELPAGSTGEFGIKEKNKFDGQRLVEATEWIKTGTGVDTVYTFEPDFNGAALSALLHSGDGNISNDITTVECIAEIKWITDGKKRRTPTVTTIIENDVLKTDDLSPTPAWSAIGYTAPVNGTESGVVIVTSSTAPDMSDNYQFAGIGVAANYYFSTLYPEVLKCYRNSETGMWLIAYTSVFDQELTPSNRFQSSDDVEFPWLVTTWMGYGDLSGQSVTSTIEDPGTPATAAPPHVRVAGDFLYVKDGAGIWKKTALSALSPS